MDGGKKGHTGKNKLGKMFHYDRIVFNVMKCIKSGLDRLTMTWCCWLVFIGCTQKALFRYFC